MILLGWASPFSFFLISSFYFYLSFFLLTSVLFYLSVSFLNILSNA